MARPTYDTKTMDATGGASFSWSHTCTGSNRGLLVGICAWQNAAETVSTITYNSVSLTKEVSIDPGSRSGDGHFVEIWSLINPASGSNTIAVTMSGSTTCQALGISFSDANQSDLAGDTSTAVEAATSTAVTVDVTSDSDAVVVDFVSWWVSGSPSMTAGGGQTSRHADADAGGTGAAASTEDGAGTTTMSWTIGTAAAWATAGISVNGIIPPPGVPIAWIRA